MAWSLRGCAALLVLAPLALSTACTCREPAPAPTVSAADVVVSPPPAALPELLPGTEALLAETPRVRAAVETANDLFLGRYEVVNARLEPGLRQQLSPAALREVVAGVVAAHGEPAQVVDAWASELREEERTWPTSSVLLRMSRSATRFRLLLVFNPDDSLRGLWLRPI